MIISSHFILAYPEVNISHTGSDQTNMEAETTTCCAVAQNYGIKCAWGVIENHTIIVWCQMISVASFCAIEFTVP